jgi:tetratricopeptide (TPR) repeat protein
MGFSRVVFGGIDLCHSRDGYSHAMGSNEHDAGPRLGGTGMRVKTNAGRDAETTPDFFNAISSFGVQATAASRAGVAVINPAADAAVIEGVEFQTLEKIDLERPGVHPFETLHARLPPDTPAVRVANLSAMQRELRRANGRLRRVVELSEEALECNDGLFGRKGKTANFRHKRRMDKIERHLDTKLKDMSEIVRMFSSRAFLHMPPSDREWTDEEIEQAGKTYYSAYLDNARAVLALVEQAQERVAAAIEEEDEAPDFERLFGQWQRDAVPGRALAWRHRHPLDDATLAETVRQQFDRCERAFLGVMEQRDTSHARKVRDEVSLEPVRGRLQILFMEGNAQDLAKTRDQLAGLRDPEATQLIHLAEGYLAELKEEPEAAFAAYGKLIDDVRQGLAQGDAEHPNPCLEDALRRMVFIALSREWHDRALLILETLAGLSPAYEPQFAELLRLSGHVEAAANVYTDYLRKAPGDHVAMLRLGKLYQAMGAVDAAKTAFSYVLENDPRNQAALSLLRQIETAA